MKIKKGITRVALCLIMACLAAVLSADASFAAEGTALEVTVPVKQNFVKTGTDRSVSEQFSYVLTPQKAENPLPDGSTNGSYMLTLTGNEETNLSFRYTHAGEYIYQLKESVTNSQTGYTYDSTVYTVKVYAENYNNSLISEVIIQNDNNEKLAQAVFNNSYQPIFTDSANMVDPLVRKTVSGNPGKNDVFTFVLKADNASYPMPSGSADGIKKIQIAGSGTSEFGTWSYTEAGTYGYTVYEENSSLSGYTYDANVYTITDVAKDENGQLRLNRTIKVGQQSATEFAFVNSYSNPGTHGIVKTGDTGNPGIWLLVLLVSVCAVILLILLAKHNSKRTAMNSKSQNNDSDR